MPEDLSIRESSVERLDSFPIRRKRESVTGTKLLKVGWLKVVWLLSGLTAQLDCRGGARFLWAISDGEEDGLGTSNSLAFAWSERPMLVVKIATTKQK